ncbi:hypothetical protein [Caldicellulosiruptor morganii]|uniref:Guanylate cyclase domain-containing protein n=1 Tax=Caldicellulosiruptor morganii TaxID=1387555 RepID=A0ABY7BMD7_9FIRM|nr:hypothetical protein [Caldicellulosiruptor morganii]WAM33047.1 hypothetical protein OTK00_001508 [Caldicellulosiruptor morganii]
MLKDFNGETFVAFVDISGFKKILCKDEEKAKEILGSFYSIGYRELKNFNPTNYSKCYSLNGIFVSDCGIIYVSFCKGYRYIDEPAKKKNVLKAALADLLLCLKNMCRSFLEKRELLSVGVYYGNFVYQNRLEHERIDKNFIYGEGYLKAFELCEKYAVGGEFICNISGSGINLFNNCKNSNFRNKDGLIVKKINESERLKDCFRVYWMLDEDDSEKIREIDKYYTELHQLRVGNKERNSGQVSQDGENKETKDMDQIYVNFKDGLYKLLYGNNNSNKQ